MATGDYSSSEELFSGQEKGNFKKRYPTYDQAMRRAEMTKSTYSIQTSNSSNEGNETDSIGLMDMEQQPENTFEKYTSQLLCLKKNPFVGERNSLVEVRKHCSLAGERFPRHQESEYQPKPYW